MWPPLATGPSISTSGPSRPLVKVSTKTVWWACVTAGSVAMACLGSWLELDGESAPGDRGEQREFVTGRELLPTLGVHASDDRKSGVERIGQRRVGAGEAVVDVSDRRSRGKLERHHGRGSEPRDAGAETNPNLHSHSEVRPKADPTRDLTPGRDPGEALMNVLNRGYGEE